MRLNVRLKQLETAAAAESGGVLIKPDDGRGLPEDELVRRWDQYIQTGSSAGVHDNGVIRVPQSRASEWRLGEHRITKVYQWISDPNFYNNQSALEECGWPVEPPHLMGFIALDASGTVIFNADVDWYDEPVPIGQRVRPNSNLERNRAC